MDTLKDTLKEVMSLYAGEGAKCYAYPLFDDVHSTYAINVVDFFVERDRAELVILARIVGDKIVIEEDYTDKPLYQALLNKGLQREQLILAYDGDSYPTGSVSTTTL